MPQQMEPRVPCARSPKWRATCGSRQSISSPTAATRPRSGSRRRQAALAARPPGKLILVSAITPTPAGEGKTTTSIGLAQGLHRIGKRAALALRQPSMGPVFGRKGGATGGGASRVEPSNTINLQFTGDFHAITAAHNLLAAAIDNRLHFRDIDLDPTRVLWKRVLDMNDRRLRHIVIGLGGQLAGRAARVGLRHHGGQRGHGDPLPGRLAGRSCDSARSHPGRLHARAASRCWPRRSA